MAERIDNQKTWKDVCGNIAQQDLTNLLKVMKVIQKACIKYDEGHPAFVLVGSAVGSSSYNDLDLVVLPVNEQENDHFGFTQGIEELLGKESWLTVTETQAEGCYEAKESWRLVPDVGKTIELLFCHPLRYLRGYRMLTLKEFLGSQEGDGNGPFALVEDGTLA